MQRSVQQASLRILLLAILMLGIVSTAAAQLVTDLYEIRPYPIEKRMRIETFHTVELEITNKDARPMAVELTPQDNLSDYILVNPKGAVIDPQSKSFFNITLLADSLGRVNGTIRVTGTETFSIPVVLELTEVANSPIQSLSMDVDVISPKVIIGNEFTYKVDVTNLVSGEAVNASLVTVILQNVNDTEPAIIFTENMSFAINSTASFLKEVTFNASFPSGEYIINASLFVAGESSSYTQLFTARYSFFQYSIFGVVKVYVVLIALGVIGLVGSVGYWFHKQAMKKRRYKANVDYSTMPKPGPRVVRLGRYAETTKDMYYEIEQLKTHTLIAGSTGGGKTVSAEVIAEEALLQGAAVICFDPTAQWSGFLRKNTNKKMFTLYEIFGMKPSEAKAFNGNVRQLDDPREYVDITKFMKPGEITVFTLTKLDPKDVDIVVASTIKQVFKANFDEHPLLRLLIVFDEVHRLLPKFGGSGAGFTQIERGAREFRKWGVGLMLISQVLSDFAGEIKANITTEIQMRTRDQGDLDRIKVKYGDYMLQSLVKSATGVGMMQNSAYNRGNPFFVWFRPLLHEHARLTNEELDQYSKYNNILDDLEYQLEQLEQEGIDIFDLKLEFKMALDKVKSGNFNMVNIYLEGLTPRVQEHWTKLGKTPKKKEKLLVSEEEIQKDIAKAKAERAKFEAAKPGGGGAAAPPPAEAKAFPLLRLDSGVVAVNPIELADALAVMSEADLKKEINDKKNTFADWVGNVDPVWGEAIRKVGLNKTELVHVLESGPPKEAPKKEEGKKDEKK